MRSSRHRRRRSHKLLAATIAILVLASIGAADLGWVALKGRADQLQANLTNYLQAGQGELEAGKASLTQASTDHDLYWALRATDHFLAAQAQFLAARQLADNSRLLEWLERTPGASNFVRSRHSAVDGIATMGIAISQAGQELSSLDGQLIKPPAGQGGRTLLTVLGEARTSLAKVKDDFAAAKTAASPVEVGLLPAAEQATFVKARATIDLALAGLDEFERLFPVLTEVLGGNGPRTYLVEQVNPAELRPGGGFIGTYSVLRADHGTLNVVRSGDAYVDLASPRPLPGQRGFMPQPGPYREIIPDISWSFIDSNLYPDFPSNAKTAEAFVQPRIGKIDAVISIDYYSVAEMLSLTGPVTVPGFGTLTASNFISRIIQLDIAGAAIRKTVLATIAGPLMQRVAALSSDRWPALIGALNTLASQRHLQAYFNDATLETEIDRVGWSGSVRPTGAGEFMMEVEANYWGNKTNYFLTRGYTVVLAKIGNTLHHIVAVDLVNATVCGSEDRTSYRANFRLFVADTASDVANNLRPVRYANPAPPAGTHAADGWIPDVGCGGGRAQATFTYDTPFVPSAGGVDQIYWQKQPGTVADTIALIWTDGTGHPYVTSGTLDQDRIISLSATGVSLTAGQPAQATLPSLSLG